MRSNRLFKIFRYSVLTLAALFVLLLLGVNLPPGQRFITSKVNGFFLSKNIPAHVEKVTLLLNGKIGVKHLRVIQNQHDTILYVRNLRVAFQPIAFLFKKVKAGSLLLDDAVINLATDDSTGILNLSALFAEKEKPIDTAAVGKKKWDIQVRSVTLKNILFNYHDIYHGIQLSHSSKDIYMRFNRFSLLRKEINAAFVNLDKIRFNIATNTPRAVTTKEVTAPSAWIVNLKNADLKDVVFTSDQPEANQRLVVRLGAGNIAESHVDLGQHLITIGELQLDKPDLFIFSSAEKNQTAPHEKGNTDISFPGQWDITGNLLTIDNGSVRMATYAGPFTIAGHGINRIVNVATTLKHVKISHQASAFNLSRLSVALGNGLQIEQGKVVFHSDSISKTTLQLALKTTFSTVEMNLKSGEGLPSIIRKSFLSVPFSLDISKSEISLHELFSILTGYHDPQKTDQIKDDKVSVLGSFSGSSDLLNLDKLTLSSPAGARLIVAGSVTRLTDTRTAECNVNFNTSALSDEQIKELTEITGISLKLPPMDPATIRGNIRNRIMAPEIALTIKGGSGNIGIKGSADLAEKSYVMELVFSDLKIGSLTGVDDLDNANGSMTIDGQGFNPDSIVATASLTIEKAGFKGYGYRNINLKAKAYAGFYTFHLLSSDNAAEFSLTGFVSRQDSITDGEISGSFAIRTGELHLYPDSIDFEGNLKAEVHHTPSTVSASLTIPQLNLTKGNHSGELRNAFFSILSADSIIKTRVRTGFLKADFQSHISLEDLKKAFQLPEYELAALLDSVVTDKLPVISSLPDAQLTLEATYSPLLNFFVPDTVFSYNHISARLTKEIDGIATGTVYIDQFKFNNIAGFASTVELESLPGKTTLTAKTDSIRVSTIRLGLTGAEIILTEQKAVISIKAGDRHESVVYDIACEAIKNNNLIEVRSTQPQWTLNGYPWMVSPTPFLVMVPGTNDYTVDLHWKNDKSLIDIYGNSSGKLNFDFGEVTISKLIMQGILPYRLDGELTGNVNYLGGEKQIINAGMIIRQIQASGRILGDLKIKGQYASDTLGSIESNLNVLIDNSSELLVSAKLGSNPEKGIHTEFNNLSLHYLEPFLEKFISGLTGEISGDMDLSYPENDPELNGSIRFKETGFRIIPLNAKFTIPGDEIVMKKSQLIFDQFFVLDSLRKRLNVEGKINLNNQKNVTADLKVTSDNLQVMNTTEKDNPSFNGSVFINSKLSITGPVQNPSITGNLVLAGGTVINYRFVENLTVSETQKIIRFASLREDQATDLRQKKEAVKKLSNSPNLEASIEIDPKTIFNFQINRGFDIGVQINGGGFLNYAMLPNSTMSLSGRYEIQKGRADLKITGFPRKNFTISAGSHLKWDGKVDDPELQIETTSKVKGSYLNPVDNKNREVDFMVYMKLSNRLSQLEITFDVKSEDQYITTVLSSLSMDERMKQAINLLIFERIELPNVASSSNIVTQQINQFWESQLNQFTKSTIKNVDISFGLNTYKGASEGGGEQEYTSFTYEVKKQMFNNRGSVMVSGKMNDNSAAGEQANNVIDNFTFEYALDTNRMKFLKVYRQQNYEDLLEGEVTKSGVGFIYRKTYNRLSDIWRRQKKMHNPEP